MKTINDINKTRGALKRFGLALAASAAVVLGSGLTANAAPTNDNFTSAIELIGATGTQTGTDTIDATLQAGEPDPGATNTVWFKWTCTADGALTVDTFGSTDPGAFEWDAILGIYTGASLNALTPLGATPKDTGDKETMTVPVTAGTTYYIQLAGWQNTVAANIQLNWNLVETIYEADVLTFGPGGVIDQGLKTILWAVPFGVNPATLAPTFTLSPGATCTVGGLPVHSGDPVNLTGPVGYTVTAKGSSPAVNTYTVTVTFAPNESALVWSAGGSGDWDFTTFNWIGQTSGTNQPFANALNVIFSDPAGGTINITSVVFPLTTTVSATSGTYTFSGGPIAAGSITKGGSGRLNIDGLLSGTGTVVSNTYSGGTIMNSGLLHLGAMFSGISPDITGTVGTGPVTLNGGTIEFDRVTETSALIVNGGTLYSQNGWGVRWNGPITLNGTLTCQTLYGMTYSGAISGTGGLLKTGNDTLTLSGVNSYSGATTVTAGRLQCNNANALGRGALSISAVAKVNLNYTGEHNVASLTLNGVAQTSGTYGSTASPAANKNDTYFIGTGMVRVPASSLKNMLTFSFGVLGNAAIAGTNITLLVPPGTDRTQLAPTYTVSPGATGSPLSGTPHNFTSPQVYTVTAEDSSTLAYQVTVSEAILPDIFAWTNTASGNWSVAANWTNENASGEAPVGGGRSSYTLNFNAAGTYTATNNLNIGFVLNRLNLGGPTLTLAGNSLAFAANGATLPQINQNSAAACTISVPVNLANNTTVGGTGAASMSLQGAISGPGSLTKTNPGTLRISGAPSHTGGTHVKAGTLFLYAAETGFAPNAAPFSIADVTVESGATLEGYRAHLVGKLTLNGGRYWEYNGYNDGGWWGPIYLVADSFFGKSDGWCYAQTLGGEISGPGGFTYDSYNNQQGAPLTLSVANSYTGPTIVNSGKVVCKNPSSLGNGGALSINSPGLVNLNYTGTHFVSALTIDGAPMSRGVYGSSSSGAAFPDDSHFDVAGTGTVTVPGPAEIVAFVAAGHAGAIDQAASTINVTVPYGTDLATLAPTFTLSSGACTPTSGTPPTPSFAVQNPATYTVIDGTTTTTYLVTVTVADPPIIVGASGSGTLTFDALPPITKWSTLSVPGGAGDITTDGGIDSAMSAIDASSINAELLSQGINTANGLAIWRSDLLTLFTRPTGNKMTLLMATLGNFSGSTIDTLAVSYKLSVENTPTEEIRGYRVYWSKTGAAGSWAALGDSTILAPGTNSVELKLPGIACANGQMLYMVWADDNGSGTEGYFRLDNMTFGPAQPPPTPTLPPGSLSIATGGVPTFTNVPTTAGYTYWLTYKNNLTDPTWTRIGTGTAGGGSKTFTDTVTPYPAHRFYALEVQ